MSNSISINMKTINETQSVTTRIYEIEVKQTDFYSKIFRITSESESIARQTVRDMIEEEPLDAQKNTYDATETDITVFPQQFIQSKVCSTLMKKNATMK
jgi:hypothetical protein